MALSPGPARSLAWSPGQSPTDSGIRKQLIHSDADSEQFLWTGFAINLHTDAAESYYFNLMGEKPSVFVVCRLEHGRLQPFLVTCSYDEADAYMEVDESVSAVAMPPEIYRWCEAFVLAHYVPEKKRKRKRDNWKQGDQTTMKDEDGITSETQAGPDPSEGLLARWSRRKLEAAGTDQSAPPPIPEATEEQGVRADIAADEPALTDDDMPPIESLTEDSDYSVFLSPKVSEALRQQALQKLFRMTQFNVCDGLDDYAEDFTQFAGLGDIVTHEMRQMLERQKEKTRGSA